MAYYSINPDNCIVCGACVEACPRALDYAIIEGDPYIIDNNICDETCGDHCGD